MGCGASCGNTTRIRPDLNSINGTCTSVSADKSGMLIRDSSHDYNPGIGGLPNLLSFEEKFPDAFKVYETAFVQYMQYVSEVQDGTGTEEIQRRPVKSLMELRADDLGFPVLPPAVSDPTKDILDYQKHLIRSFLTAHYSKIQFLSEVDILKRMNRTSMWPAGGTISLAILCNKQGSVGG